MPTFVWHQADGKNHHHRCFVIVAYFCSTTMALLGTFMPSLALWDVVGHPSRGGEKQLRCWLSSRLLCRYMAMRRNINKADAYPYEIVHPVLASRRIHPYNTSEERRILSWPCNYSLLADCFAGLTTNSMRGKCNRIPSIRAFVPSFPTTPGLSGSITTSSGEIPTNVPTVGSH